MGRAPWYCLPGLSRGGSSSLSSAVCDTGLASSTRQTSFARSRTTYSWGAERCRELVALGGNERPRGLGRAGEAQKRRRHLLDGRLGRRSGGTVAVLALQRH
jgi:hypothetical protein